MRRRYEATDNGIIQISSSGAWENLGTTNASASHPDKPQSTSASQAPRPPNRNTRPVPIVRTGAILHLRSERRIATCWLRAGKSFGATRSPNPKVIGKCTESLNGLPINGRAKGNCYRNQGVESCRTRRVITNGVIRMPLVDHPGEYHFLPGISPYSCGVVSAPGFIREHAIPRFRQPSWSRALGNCPRESWLTRRSSELAMPSESMTQKASFVIDLMETRLHGLGVDWSEVTAVDVYTIHALERILSDVILRRIGSAGIHGVHWYLSRRPIVGIEFEMDLRGIRTEDRL
jgi:hypothetical protein